MGYLQQQKEVTPAAPAANYTQVFPDSAEGNRLKQIDETGLVNTLTNNGLRATNMLINGGFNINQRLAAALSNIPSPSLTARVMTGDRWGFTIGNVTTPQFQQVDARTATEAGLLAEYYARYKQLTNAAKMLVTQVVSADNTSRLRGKTVRLSAKMRYSVGSNRNIRMSVHYLTSAGAIDTMPASYVPAFNGASTDPTWGTNITALAPVLVDNCTISGLGATCGITAAWQRFSATFAVPSNCLNVIVAIWNDTIGAASDDLLLTEVGLYLGQEIIDWTPLTLELELIRCQRYYQKTFPQGVAPAQNAGLAGAAKGLVTLIAAAALASNIFLRFKQTMFKTPTITLFNPSVANAAMRRYTATATDQTATATANVTTDDLEVTATGDAAGIVGDKVAIHIAVDAEI